MVQFNTVYQLKTINEMLAQVGSVDAEVVEHARKAMLFFENERNDKDSEDVLLIGIERLLKLYFGQSEDRLIGIEHWHIPNEEIPEFLWLRKSINEKLLHCSGYSCALFLITGLRESILGNNVNWTKRHNQQFKDTKEWIESYVVSRTPSQQMLNLLII
ncbi:MAG: hypothetical protein P8I61_05535 [Opitutae bacterium]|jgi:hypothetical protein|nr:hypothetical protein [Opitutae bacterium]